jgi:hypothetical protein
VRSSKYNAPLLAPIVASSRTLGDVLRRLGLRQTGGNYRNISARIRLAGLDVSHFRTRTLAARVAAISRQELMAHVEQCVSIAEVLAKLEMPTEGRSHYELTRRLDELEIDTSHFRGQGWARGETNASHPSVARTSLRKSYTNDEVFMENSPLVGGQRITPRLLALGWAYRCAWCGIAEWCGKPLVLHLDHINGINNDNRLINLRLLCPNCPSQTETYGNRRR